MGGLDEYNIHYIIYASELAIAAIILFYVIEMLTMPANMKRVCQGLIVLIAVLSVIGTLLGAAPPPHVGPLSPNSPSIPASFAEPVGFWRRSPHVSADCPSARPRPAVSSTMSR